MKRYYPEVAELDDSDIEQIQNALDETSDEKDLILLDDWLKSGINFSKHMFLCHMTAKYEHVL